MAKTQTILQVFVASPGDVVEERKILEEVITEFNMTWSDTHKVHLDLLKWETHSRPGFGEDAQDVINEQIGDEYDIFIGIMWGRFGSPTKRSDSGTEEEFERAYARLAGSPNPVQIMFYFKDAGIPPSKLDPEQLSKVQAFKHKLSSGHGGLYYEFETAEEFQTKCRIHLSKLVQDWLKAPGATGTTKTESPPTSTHDEVDSLANLRGLSDDDEEGLFDLAERANDAMAALVGVVTKMIEAINDIGAKLELRTKEANALTAGGATPDAKAVKRVSNNAANDFEVYVNRMSVEIPEFHKQHIASMDAFGKMAMISATDLNEGLNDIRMALGQIQKYRAAISTSSDSLTAFRESTAALPRMTTVFNRARKRAVAVMDDLLAQFRSAARQSEDVEELLKGMLE